MLNWWRQRKMRWAVRFWRSLCDNDRRYLRNYCHAGNARLHIHTHAFHRHELEAYRDIHA